MGIFKLERIKDNKVVGELEQHNIITGIVRAAAEQGIRIVPTRLVVSEQAIPVSAELQVRTPPVVLGLCRAGFNGETAVKEIEGTYIQDDSTVEVVNGAVVSKMVFEFGLPQAVGTIRKLLLYGQNSQALTGIFSNNANAGGRNNYPQAQDMMTPIIPMFDVPNCVEYAQVVNVPKSSATTTSGGSTWLPAMTSAITVVIDTQGSGVDKWEVRAYETPEIRVRGVAADKTSKDAKMLWKVPYNNADVWACREDEPTNTYRYTGNTLQRLDSAGTPVTVATFTLAAVKGLSWTDGAWHLVAGDSLYRLSGNTVTKVLTIPKNITAQQAAYKVQGTWLLAVAVRVHTQMPTVMAPAFVGLRIAAITPTDLVHIMSVNGRGYTSSSSYTYTQSTTKPSDMVLSYTLLPEVVYSPSIASILAGTQQVNVTPTDRDYPLNGFRMDDNGLTLRYNSLVTEIPLRHASIGMPIAEAVIPDFPKSDGESLRVTYTITSRITES